MNKKKPKYILDKRKVKNIIAAFFGSVVVTIIMGIVNKLGDIFFFLFYPTMVLYASIAYYLYKFTFFQR